MISLSICLNNITPLLSPRLHQVVVPHHLRVEVEHELAENRVSLGVPDSRQGLLLLLDPGSDETVLVVDLRDALADLLRAVDPLFQVGVLLQQHRVLGQPVEERVDLQEVSQAFDLGVEAEVLGEGLQLGDLVEGGLGDRQQHLVLLAAQLGLQADGKDAESPEVRQVDLVDGVNDAQGANLELVGFREEGVQVVLLSSPKWSPCSCAA